ncbi:MAG: cobalamin biosynthesis protein CobW [Lachnospiraceae bacterium]|nr:cobalamin biosynthesis protein CobW [Lachnospiraceae bacterium]
MTKIDIVSGFLGAGKTTFIQKMLKDVLYKEQVVLIENEFGEIGIDGGFLKDAGIEIKEMNSGCICCSLVGDFGTALKEVVDTYHPERILIEPSGVGKLSDVIKAVADLSIDKEDMKDVCLNAAVAVVDVSKCKMYIKNFGEFFLNQIENAGTIVLSRTQNVKQEKIEEAVKLLREHNEKATIITTPWDLISGEQILSTMEEGDTLEEQLLEEVRKHHHEHHHHHDHDEDCDCGCHDHEHHHHHDHDEDCDCGCHDHEHHHHHDHDEDCDCGCHDHEHHHHHDHDEDCDCGCHDHEHHHHDHEHHEHHHDHGPECTCGCHDHDHHHHHHADEVFTSCGFETPKTFTKEEITEILEEIENVGKYGLVLRAKGMVPAADGTFIYFDYVPEETNVREGQPDVTGKICVIGSKISEDNLKELFGI